MGGYLGRQVIGVREDTREELQRLINSCSFIAKKEDWLDLPAKIYTTRDVELTKEQQKHYRAIEKDFITKLKNDTEISVRMVISALLKMQQITSGFIIDDNGNVHDLVDPGKNPRINEMADVIEDAGGKVLIFTHYRHSLQILREALARYNPAVLQGGMPEDLLQTMKTAFNEEDDCRVMIAQLGVGGLGHTLLGSKAVRCATTVFYENNFSLGDRLQAENRNHRIGQDQAVTYVDFLSSGIDRKVIAALQKKRDLMESMLEGVI